MPKYKVVQGKRFGNLDAGEVVDLTEQQAAEHPGKLQRVSDTRNDLGIVIDPAQKLFQSVLTDEQIENDEDSGTIGQDWSSMTVAELRGELEKRGLSTVGNKAELIERLEEDDKESED